MKKSTEIIGLPIISIEDGKEIGKVKTLVINPEKASVDFLTIDQEEWQTSLKAIPFKRVIGIGAFAVTIENENAIIDLNEIPIAHQLVNKKIRITDTRVMTRQGELIGEAGEYVVNAETGGITGIQLTADGNTLYLRSDFIVTYGKEIIIVKENVQDGYAETAEALAGPAAEEDRNEEMLALKSKQAELLEGKIIQKDIFAHDGSLLAAEGTRLDEETIRRAQEAGPAVFVELSMNVGE